MKKGRAITPSRRRVRRMLAFILVLGVLGGFWGGMHFALRAPEQARQLRDGALRSGAAVVKQAQHYWRSHVSAEPTGAKTTSSAEPVRVFFVPAGGEQGSRVEKAFLEMVRGARKSILCAFYDLEREEIAEALVERFADGIAVAVVSDSDYAGRAAVMRCIEAGIPVVFDERSSLMHNKFCVVDGAQVWTGSTNMTNNCLYLNNNNALWIRSAELAWNFTTEFEEMFSGNRFGAASPVNTPYPEVLVGATRLECCFAPEDGVEKKVIAQLNEARKRIDFMAFVFTSEPIAKVMMKELDEGTRVRGLIEKRGAGSPHSRHGLLQEHGAEIYTDNNPNTMHHKVIVVDEAVVMTGSYNFSASAETRNDENLLVIHDADIARQYVEELDRILGQ